MAAEKSKVEDEPVDTKDGGGSRDEGPALDAAGETFMRRHASAKSRLPRGGGTEFADGRDYRNPQDLAREAQTFLHLLVSWATAPADAAPVTDLDREAWSTLKDILDKLLGLANKARATQKAALSVQLADKLAEVYRQTLDDPEIGIEEEEDLIKKVFAEHGMFFSDDAAGFTSYQGPGIPTVVPQDALDELALTSAEISAADTGSGPREAARKSLARSRLFHISASQIQNRQEKAWPTALAHEAPFEFFGVKPTYPAVVEFLRSQVLSRPLPWTAFGAERPDAHRLRMVNIQGFEDPVAGAKLTQSAFAKLRPDEADRLVIMVYVDEPDEPRTRAKD